MWCRKVFPQGLLCPSPITHWSPPLPSPPLSLPYLLTAPLGCTAWAWMKVTLTMKTLASDRYTGKRGVHSLIVHFLVLSQTSHKSYPHAPSETIHLLRPVFISSQSHLHLWQLQAPFSLSESRLHSCPLLLKHTDSKTLYLCDCWTSWGPDSSGLSQSEFGFMDLK